MIAHIPTSMFELLAEIDRAWTALNTTLDKLTPAQMVSPTDSLGWAVKDHLNHIAAWNNGEAYRLQGKPMWEGMGITKDDMQSGEDDVINAAVFAVYGGNTADEARAFLRESHEGLLDYILPMTDEQLAGPFRQKRPDEPADRVIAPLSARLWSVTAEHYDEHRGWLEALTAGEA